MLHDERDAIVGDPGDSAPVIAALAANGLTLAGILVTHHHADHLGGVDALRPWLKGVVHGPAREPIPQPYVPRVDGNRINVAGAALPCETRVCYAHEYTLANVRFAHAVEPDNRELASCTRHCETLRAHGVPTLPGAVGQERLINPFLRCGQPAVVQAARRHGAASDGETDVFTALRQWKNNFR